MSPCLEQLVVVVDALLEDGEEVGLDDLPGLLAAVLGVLQHKLESLYHLDENKVLRFKKKKKWLGWPQTLWFLSFL